VFDLPGLPVKNGKRIRVFNNRVFANNHANFASKGTMVAIVAPGTGMMVMATSQVEIFKNTIKDNQTSNLAIVSFLITKKPDWKKDKEYDPFPEGISIHDNTFSGGGNKPSGELGLTLHTILGEPMPDILFDGIVNPAKLKSGKLPGHLGLCIKNNGKATFANLHWAEMPDLSKFKDNSEVVKALLAHRAKVEHDLKPYECDLPRLPEVKLAGAP
jgi:hypothetical protein